ncbi:MAG: hypothetical protein AAFV80_02845 [Bacteroidota bacterium]
MLLQSLSLFALLLFGMTGLAQSSSDFVAAVEQAHQKKKFDKYDYVAFDLQLFFGGKERFNGRVYSTTNSSAIRLDYEDGTRLVFDGQKCYSNKEKTSEQSWIFDLFTWQYFFVAPYKFSDPGTVWQFKGPAQLNDKDYETAKLTFEPGTGVSHRDWYLAYADNNQQLRAMSYIVTLGKSTEEANQEPHAITYEAFQTVKGIPFATNWAFWDWSAEAGLSNQLGEAKIQNIILGKKQGDLFQIQDRDLVIWE